jgi:4-amino-4-deoxy-L-arabinose transferase-like glycosyltransferase
MKNKLSKLLLLLIITLAFGLRIYKVTTIPPSLNWDETSIAYNAYSILKTGKDEWGQFMPLHFKSFGEYKLPAQIYASIPGIFLFGLNEFGVRITPVVYGTLTVLLLYFLTQEMFKKRTISLLSAFLLAVSPWHIQLTRASFESSFSLFWVLMAIWFLIKSLKDLPAGRQVSKWLVISAIPFAVSVYTYNTARIFTPLFLFITAIVYFKKFWEIKKISIIAGALFFLLMLPLIPFVLSGEASARYKLVSITDDAGLIPRIEERRNLSKLPSVVTKLIHNRYTYNTFYFSKNYLAHFTPNFLFFNGAGHKQHHVQGVGELYWIQAPFLLYGLYFLLKKKSKSLKILIPWLLIAFIPVSMTNDSIPNALRTLIAVPVYQIFTAVGIYEFIQLKKHTKIVLVATSVLFIINFYIFITNLYTLYPIRYSKDWQYGNKQVVEYIKEHIDEYSLIIFTRHYGEPHIFTLFYLKYDPARFQSRKNLERFETYDWVRVLRFDRFYFPDLGDEGTRYEDIIKTNRGKKILFIGKSGDFPKESKILQRIYFLDGTEAFEITDNQ